jgi:Ser/Thr protein kinase RdoA (MazF antagonist)
MDEAGVRKIIEQYGLEALTLQPVQKGYRNQSYAFATPDRQQLNLILYKNEPGMAQRIKRANQVADYLAEQGLPARATVDQRIIRVQSGPAIKYGALYTYLSGSTIPWEAYTHHHLNLLGQSLSDMHHALANFDAIGLPAVTDEYISIIERMRIYFDLADVKTAMSQKLDLALGLKKFDELSAVMTACRTLPGQQALHMDFVRGNVVFDGPQLTGILDFEKTAYGHPLFDIARTLAFLLVDCRYKSEVQTRKYFLQSGYRKRGAAEYRDIPIKRASQTSSLLETLVDMFLLYDLYKFLHHNPYEFLAQNHHFKRTVSQLKQRGLVDSTTAR